MGSTYTKGALVNSFTGELLETASVPTTLSADVWEGVSEVRARIAGRHRHTPDLHDHDAVRICSSAGGGLRLAIVGFERDVSAVAGSIVALSAGARVIHCANGHLSAAEVSSLRDARPDLILLVGGTDGGNANVALRNARALAEARLPAACVVACNAEAQIEAADILRSGGCSVLMADNVLPRIGSLTPVSARAAIRSAFLQHVIGGKGLSEGPQFAAAVRCPTPDAVLDGVQVLRDVSDHDVMLIDIGGATTDVYSAVRPQGEDASLAKEVVGTLWTARTVEGDLGMRHSASTVLDAAQREGLSDAGRADVQSWAARASRSPHLLAETSSERSADLRLAWMAALIAARRHARPLRPGGSARALAEVGTLIGSGGVLRYADPVAADVVLRGVCTDLGGGWRPPERARRRVDTAYLLCAVGLLAHDYPDTAASLAAGLLEQSQGR
ncbi:MAG: glutamate mutase L [Ornithinimicrobium sp.]